MRKNLFWLNDEEWQKIEPFLPVDVRGKDRMNDLRLPRRNSRMVDLMSLDPRLYFS